MSTPLSLLFRHTLQKMSFGSRGSRGVTTLTHLPEGVLGHIANHLAPRDWVYMGASNKEFGVVLSRGREYTRATAEAAVGRAPWRKVLGLLSDILQAMPQPDMMWTSEDMHAKLRDLKRQNADWLRSTVTIHPVRQTPYSSIRFRTKINAPRGNISSMASLSVEGKAFDRDTGILIDDLSLKVVTLDHVRREYGDTHPDHVCVRFEARRMGAPWSMHVQLMLKGGEGFEVRCNMRRDGILVTDTDEVFANLVPILEGVLAAFPPTWLTNHGIGFVVAIADMFDMDGMEDRYHRVKDGRAILSQFST